MLFRSSDAKPIDRSSPGAKSGEPKSLYSGKLAKPAASPVISENPFESQQADTAKRGSAEQGKLKQQALNLMTAAREDMQSGKFESAYQKALMASNVDVTWNLLDERPQQLMSEIERRQRRASESAEQFVDATPAKKPSSATKAAPTFEDDSASEQIGRAHV